MNEANLPSQSKP